MFFYNSFSCGNGIFVFTFVFVILHTNPLKTFLPLPSNRINGLRYIPPRPLYFIELALKAFNIKSINRSIHDDDDDLMGNYLSIFCFCFCYSFILQEYTPCELASLVFFFLQNSGFSPLTNESILPCMCILCYSDDDDDGCIRNGCG